MGYAANDKINVIYNVSSRSSTMIFGFIKNLFKPSPINRTFQNCVEADQTLLVTVMTFYQSYKTVGIELSPDTSSFDQLEDILKNYSPDTKDTTLDAVAAFLGCIVREQLGGKWTKTPDGRYKITRIGDSAFTVDLADDLRSPLASETRPRLEDLYNKIAKQAAKAIS